VVHKIIARFDTFTHVSFNVGGASESQKLGLDQTFFNLPLTIVVTIAVSEILFQICEQPFTKRAAMGFPRPDQVERFCNFVSCP